jgi:hypothetical protein
LSRQWRTSRNDYSIVKERFCDPDIPVGKADGFAVGDPKTSPRFREIDS